MDKDSVQSKYRLYKSFDEFCDNIDTPEEWVHWFVQTKHPFSTQGNEKYMTWPDALVAGEPSMCFDHAFFGYLWAEKKGYRSRLLVTGFRYKDKPEPVTHITPVLVRYNNKIVLMDVSGKQSEDSYVSYHDSFKAFKEKFNSKEFFDKMCKSDPGLIDFAWIWATKYDMEPLTAYINQKVVQNNFLAQMVAPTDIVFTMNYIRRDERS